MRLKKVIISSQLFIQLFMTGRGPVSFQVTHGLPLDSKVINARLAWPNNIEVIIQSEEFEVIAEASEPPVFDVICMHVEHASREPSLN